MIENLFIGAAKDLIAHGWIQPDITRATLFQHPEFGTHDFFKACYIQCKAEQIRRRRKLVAIIRPAVYSLIIGGILLFAAYKLTEILL